MLIRYECRYLEEQLQICLRQKYEKDEVENPVCNLEIVRS
jgi:hypothetical protein